MSFDWLALGVVVIIAIIFTIAARLHAQPATSFVPVAALSASGCGLLITALRKLRTSQGVGLLEAALAGLFLALFQWIAALSYPGVIASLGIQQIAGPGFFATWGLVTCFSILFSIIGATLGHLAFAPLRPLPIKISSTREQHEEASEEPEEPDELDAGETAIEETGEAGETSETLASQEDSEEEESADMARPTASYMISLLMFGLAPILVGYILAASFDFSIMRFGYDPGPFPTLRLLSTLLPWQVPVPITLTGPTAASTIVTLLWRIPLFFGNPSVFDVQALEPFVFNAAGLALLLITSPDALRGRVATGLRWHALRRLLLFEGLLGLLLAIPADLWIMQGLQGVLQIQSTVLPIGTLHILTTTLFVLNIITGPLVCMAVGALISKLRQPSSL